MPVTSTPLDNAAVAHVWTEEIVIIIRVQYNYVLPLSAVNMLNWYLRWSQCTRVVGLAYSLRIELQAIVVTAQCLHTAYPLPSSSSSFPLYPQREALEELKRKVPLTPGRWSEVHTHTSPLCLTSFPLIGELVSKELKVGGPMCILL